MTLQLLLQCYVFCHSINASKEIFGKPIYTLMKLAVTAECKPFPFLHDFKRSDLIPY